MHQLFSPLHNFVDREKIVNGLVASDDRTRACYYPKERTGLLRLPMKWASSREDAYDYIITKNETPSIFWIRSYYNEISKEQGFDPDKYILADYLVEYDNFIKNKKGEEFGTFYKEALLRSLIGYFIQEYIVLFSNYSEGEILPKEDTIKKDFSQEPEDIRKLGLFKPEKSIFEDIVEALRKKDDASKALDKRLKELAPPPTDPSPSNKNAFLAFCVIATILSTVSIVYGAFLSKKEKGSEVSGTKEGVTKQRGRGRL